MKPQVAGLALIGQGTLSIMWSIHREAAVQLISLDKEKQALVQCWRDHYYYLFILFILCIYETALFINHIHIYFLHLIWLGGMEFGI